MTMFGKILVLLNLALSVMLMIVAIVAYLARMDWSNNPSKDGSPEGELRARVARVTDLWNRIPGSEASWRKSHEGLTVLEVGTVPQHLDGRLANRDWYRTEIQLLLTAGDDMMGKPTVMREVALDDKFQLVPDDANSGRPKMVPAKDRFGKDLLSLAAYDKVEKGFFDALDMQLKKLDALVKEDTKLTEMLLDDYPVKGAKGLHTRLKEERVRGEEVKNELELVRRPLINTYVEAELLLKRKRQMEDRLEELKKARAAQLAGLGKN